MPKYFLPKGVTPLDNVDIVEFTNSITRKNLKGKFSSDTFSYDEKWKLYETFRIRSEPGDGEIVRYEVAMGSVGNFDDRPPFYIVPISGKDNFLEFVDKIESHPIPPIFPEGDYTRSFHIYLGKKQGETEFNIVFVPALAKNSTDGTGRDHADDKEKDLFTTDSFFSYVISKTGCYTEKDPTISRRFIIIKDSTATGDSEKQTQVAFFTVTAFNDFKDHLERTPDSLMIQFGRDENKKLNLILTFIDAAGPIVSSFTNPEAEGVCLDQGDLIPPPPNASDWNSSF